MKVGVIVFPGSNCDHDAVYTMSDIFKQEVVELWHKDTDLQGVDLVLVPGGFSYGDYLRSGAMASYSPIMESVKEFAQKGGYVVGICNGFQILCEAELLPGTLQHNEDRRFIADNCYLKVGSTDTFATHKLDKEKAYKIPVAHGEGNYYADQNTIQELIENDQVLFYYSDEDGTVNGDTNLNGSVHNIAGVINKERNVIGLMPHPERACDPALKNIDGVPFFESILERLN